MMAGAFKDLDNGKAADLPRVGGKAYNCARLKQAGFPVPDGLAIPSDATDADVRQLTNHAWVHALPESMRLAVRSSGLGEDSAGHSFAGIHETQLNVDRGRRGEAVLACRRSGAFEEARAYRRARGLDERDDGIGVLVQHMVPAATSGVAFTINPITSAGELVINAAPGLGVALVGGGSIDEFRARRRSAAILSSRAGSGARRDRGAVGRAVGIAALLVDRGFHGSPQDVEWCYAAAVRIVQSRPVDHAVGRGAGGRGRTWPKCCPIRHRPCCWTCSPIANVGQRSSWGGYRARSELG